MQNADKSFARELCSVLALVVIASGLAFLFTWSARICELHTADSILPALISTQNLTWYYWGQDRFGNLLPALTSFISDVDLNLKVQIVLRAFCAGISPAFFVLILRPKAPFLAVYCAALAAMVLLERDSLTHSYWTDAQPYGTSFALLVPPLLIARNSSWRFNFRSTAMVGLILLLLIIVLWVNLSAVLLIVPLFIGLAIVERSRIFFVLAALTLLAYELDSIHAAQYGDHEYVAFRPSWPGTMQAVSKLAEQIRTLPALLLGAGGIWAAWTLRLHHRILRTALVVLGAALIAFLVTANLQWVQLNFSLPRYFVFPVTAIIATSAILIVDAIENSFISTKLATHPLTAVSFALLIVAGGLMALPLNTQCRFIAPTAAIEEVANLVSKTNAAFVDGDYWIVWPAVFLANRDARTPVFGLTYRGQGARDAVKSYAASHPHPVILCVGKPVADCVGDFEYVLGRPLNASTREIASGELADPPSPWVAAAVDYGFHNGSTPQ